MRFLFISFLYVQLCFQSFEAEGQVDLFPRHFGQAMLARQIFNPAFPNIERRTNVTFSNQFYTGPFSMMNNLFFIGNINLNGNDSARNVNSIGVKFLNEKEGEFVARPKYYASYSFRTRISEKSWLGLGIYLGRAAYIYKGTDISTSGAASNWDGDLGIAFHHPSFCMGGSVNQFFNALVVPKDLYFRWARFYTIYAAKKINFHHTQWTVYLQHQFLPRRIDVLDVGAHVTMSKVLFIGTNVWVGRRISYQVGLKHLSLEQHHFSVYISYNMPAFLKSSINIQSFEMSVYYQLR